ncbi:MAG: DUF2807 domain-containing protein [Flavobacterium sp.]|nr:MAG: DUF2807 domain-containing protein [Flavobacterium sp.]
MKKLILFVAFLSQAAIGQITKNPGDFSSVKVFDRINVELIPSSENKVELTGDRINDVEVVNKNGELKIRMTIKKLLDGEDVEAKVYYKSLSGVDGSEGAFISSATAIRNDNFDINAKEGSQIKLPLEVGKVRVRAVTGGTVKLSGSADKMDANLGTGGILQAKDLATTETDVDIKAGGEAEVNASERVDADIKAGGNVTIYGKPRQINKNIALGGTISEGKD